MKKLLQDLYDRRILTRNEAYDVMHQISSSSFNEAEIASFMTVFQMRPISVGELAGFRNALLDMAICPDLCNDVLDVCGTGGDGKNTFNISTLTAFVAAGAGIRVAKHGNYGFSSVSGSSNILQHFGYKFTTDESILKSQLEKFNICFLHAPLFHPALHSVAAARKNLGIRTFFNLLGPLVNPCRPQFRMTGVFHRELGRMYHYLLQQEKGNYCIVTSTDGYDEVSLTAPFSMFSSNGESLEDHRLFNMEKVTSSDIYGGSDLHESASVFVDVLENRCDYKKKQVVIANAALAIQCVRGVSITDACAIARESIESGAALKIFNGIIKN